MPATIPVIVSHRLLMTFPAVAFSMGKLILSPKNHEPSISASTADSKIYVIHDGRKQEGFPILSLPPFMSIMEGSSIPLKEHPNNWRITDLRDCEYPEIAKKEFLYSEFSPLYVIWKDGIGNCNFIGKMHYRSYLNLTFPVFKANRDEIFPLNDKDKLLDVKLFQGAYNVNYTEQMGYTTEHINIIMNGVKPKVEPEKKSLDNNSVGYDILTSTPLDFGNHSITEQFIMCHGGNDNTREALVRILVKAGELIYQYNKSTYGIEDDFKCDKTAFAALRKYKIKARTSNSDKVLAFSNSWDEHVGLLNYIDSEHFSKRKNAVPFMKDLFIMRNYVFVNYMTFIYYMLENLERKCKTEIEYYKTNHSGHGSRILAFLGERLTSYFIHFMLTRMDMNVGVVPRAHYEGEQSINNFIESIFPKYDGYVPLYKFKKFLVDAEGEEKYEMRYFIPGDKIKESCEDGYAFEACVGYLKEPSSSENLDAKVFCSISSKEKGMEYKIMPRRELEGQYEGYKILGCEVTDSEDCLPLALVQDRTVKNEVYVVKGNGETFIKVATFGRTDIQ